VLPPAAAPSTQQRSTPPRIGGVTANTPANTHHSRVVPPVVVRSSATFSGVRLWRSARLHALWPRPAATASAEPAALVSHARADADSRQHNCGGQQVRCRPSTGRQVADVTGGRSAAGWCPSGHRLLNDAAITEPARDVDRARPFTVDEHPAQLAVRVSWWWQFERGRLAAGWRPSAARMCPISGCSTAARLRNVRTRNRAMGASRRPRSIPARTHPTHETDHMKAPPTCGRLQHTPLVEHGSPWCTR